MARVRVVESIRELDPQMWEQLTKAADAPVFYAWDFLLAVEQRPLTELAKPFYLLAEDSHGQVVAALPLYFQQARDPFASIANAPVRMLVGHVWHCYDTTLPCRTELDPWLLERLWAAVRQLAQELGADVYGLVNLPVRGPLCTGLAEIGVTTEATVPRYQLDLSGPEASVAAHLRKIGPASRKTLGAYVRRAQRAGMRVTVAEGTRQLDDDVLELCVATADKHAAGYYPPGPLGALITALGPRCRIIRLELDGVLLAASICLLDATRMHAWAGGCRYPDELNWSPQYVLFHSELEAGFGSGRRTLECGRRNDEFKRRYGLTAVPLARAVEYQ
jgi:predicted N-acyltransferase